MSFSRKVCPRCEGEIRIDRDEYGWYEQCIACGYLRDLKEVGITQKTGRSSQHKVKINSQG